MKVSPHATSGAPVSPDAVTASTPSNAVVMYAMIAASSIYHLLLVSAYHRPTADTVPQNATLPARIAVVSAGSIDTPARRPPFPVGHPARRDGGDHRRKIERCAAQRNRRA